MRFPRATLGWTIWGFNLGLKHVNVWFLGHRGPFFSDFEKIGAPPNGARCATSSVLRFWS